MEKIKRNGRMSAMVRILTASPNRIYTLSYFCDLFEAAKSTISEDIELLRGVFSQFSFGEIETVTGAAGGVCFRPGMEASAALTCVREVARRLRDPARVLPGGYLYMADILGSPALLDQFGAIMAGEFQRLGPDFVLTVETRGIAFAAAVARALGVPLVIARREMTAYEGPRVAIHYTSGTTGSMQSMSLARRTVREGQRCVVIDDFMKAGGALRGMTDLMREFAIEVIGMGVLMRRAGEQSGPEGLRALMTLRGLDEERGADVVAADWVGSI